MNLTSDATASHIQLEPWEVGGELLDILSRGLYSDGKDAVREYVQNGVDAHATSITLTVDGPIVTCRDDGDGMSRETIRAARRFGLSEKSPRESVGYRGIGIYSSFGICDLLEISSRQAGMDEVVGWRFDFASMRNLLERDRTASERQGLVLGDLLYEHTEFFTRPHRGKKTDHFTLVRLEGLGEQYRAQLNNLAELSDYLLNTIPIAFPDEDYGTVVNDLLRQHVGLNPVTVKLRLQQEPEFEITAPIADEVSPPTYDWIRDDDGNPLAFLWHARTQTKGQIADPSVSGFLLKLKGFTLGNRQTLKPLWPPVGGRTLYHHYTGEVHILDPVELYPNAARNNLEPSQRQRTFANQAQDVFVFLSREANLARQVLSAQDALRDLDPAVTALEARRADANSDFLELYRESRNSIDELAAVSRNLIRHLSVKGARTKTTQYEPSSELKLAADEILGRVESLTRRCEAVATAAQKRAKKPARAQQPSDQPAPPQITLLEALEHDFASAFSEATDSRVKRASRGIAAALQLRSPLRAVSALDELRASGVQLPDGVERARKELRAFLGRSPIAPVSLPEALQQAGVLLESSREELIIAVVDRVLLSAGGGRGEGYEVLLRTLADALSEELGR